MSIGDRIASLRRQKNLTQEQLAGLLNVSRQSVSKWESDIAYPETDKLIQLADLFKVSADYLLRGAQENSAAASNSQASRTRENSGDFTSRENPDAESSKGNYESRTDAASNDFSRPYSNRHQPYHYEYKSKGTLFGVPLVHINFGTKMYKAHGIIAIGNVAMGLISIGLLSFGLLSIGILAIGLLALGVFAFGGFSLGAIAVGLIAIGAIAVGIFAVGAIAVGLFSVGALSVGKFVAIGHTCYGDIAIALERAEFSVLGFLKGQGFLNASGIDSSNALNYIRGVIDSHAPNFLLIFKEWIKSFLPMIL